MESNTHDTFADQAETATEAVAPSTDAVANGIIRRNVYWSMGAGVLPVAFLDTAALIAVQVKMLRELARAYDVPFRADLGKSAVGALLSSVAATGVGAGVLSSGLMRGLIYGIPIVGPVVGLATMPAFYAAFTYATGKVFQQHFASGGTFLTFDPSAVKSYFKAKFDEHRGGTANASA